MATANYTPPPHEPEKGSWLERVFINIFWLFNIKNFSFNI